MLMQTTGTYSQMHACHICLKDKMLAGKQHLSKAARSTSNPNHCRINIYIYIHIPAAEVVRYLNSAHLPHLPSKWGKWGKWASGASGASGQVGNWASGAGGFIFVAFELIQGPATL